MNPTLSSGEGKRGRGRLQLLLIIGVVLDLLRTLGSGIEADAAAAARGQS